MVKERSGDGLIEAWLSYVEPINYFPGLERLRSKELVVADTSFFYPAIKVWFRTRAVVFDSSNVWAGLSMAYNSKNLLPKSFWEEVVGAVDSYKESYQGFFNYFLDNFIDNNSKLLVTASVHQEVSREYYAHKNHSRSVKKPHSSLLMNIIQQLEMPHVLSSGELIDEAYLDDLALGARRMLHSNCLAETLTRTDKEVLSGFVKGWERGPALLLTSDRLLAFAAVQHLERAGVDSPFLYVSGVNLTLSGLNAYSVFGDRVPVRRVFTEG